MSGKETSGLFEAILQKQTECGDDMERFAEFLETIPFPPVISGLEAELRRLGLSDHDVNRVVRAVRAVILKTSVSCNRTWQTVVFDALGGFPDREALNAVLDRALLEAADDMLMANAKPEPGRSS